MEFLKVPFWAHFFLIYINDLPLCLDGTPRFFADDTALLITGKDFDSMESLANLELFKVSKWMMSNNLIVNASKTVALPLSIGRRCRCFPVARSVTDAFP